MDEIKKYTKALLTIGICWGFLLGQFALAEADVAELAINDVALERGENGSARVVIELSSSDVTAEVKQKNKSIEITLPKAGLPAHLARELSVSEYGTPVQRIDARLVDGNALIVINVQGNYEQYSYQTDKRFVVNVTPMTATQVKQQATQNYDEKNKRLTLNFQDIEVRAVLQIIADFTNLNLVASDTVGGNITLRLSDVPWDQALDLILKTKGLDKRIIGNVILVAPADELAAREKLEMEARNQAVELSPLSTEFIAINYAKAKDLATIFGSKEGVLSPRGSVVVDDRTNTILITDVPQKIREFKAIARRLDVPVKQVLIEARIVKADAEFARGLGVRWGGYYLEDSGAGLKHAGGSLQTLDDIQQSGGNNPNITKPDNLVVDLGVTDNLFNATTFAIGLLRDSSLLELELSALEGEGRGHVVSQPKIVTADQQTARIESGTEVPYQEATSSGATSVEFKDAVLSLEVTPQITPNDRIIMKLRVNQDSIGDIFNGVPSIDTNELDTQVLVQNGETIVLGGIYQTENTQTTSKTPFLGDLPVVGWLFKNVKNRNNKSELLIFITPKIVEDVNG